MDFRQLRYFLAVAETGHVTRAAAQLGLQQPPLSQALRQLEQSLGLALFERHARGVSLTDAGRQLLPGARRILGDLAAVHRQLLDHASGRAGRLDLGLTSSAAAHACTPTLLRACRQRHPGLELAITEDHAAGLTEALLERRLHVALLRVPVATPDELRFRTLLREPVWIAAPAEHPIAKAGAAADVPLPLSVLDGQPVILVRRPGAPGLYANLMAVCAQHGVRPVVAAEVARMMTALSLVAGGAGLTAVPASMCGVHAGAVRYRPIENAADLDAPLTLAWRRSEAHQGPTALFVALAEEIVAQDRAAAPPGTRRSRATRRTGSSRPDDSPAAPLLRSPSAPRHP